MADYQSLAGSFLDIARSVSSNCLRDLDAEKISRAVYGRIYYALYHKYLAHDASFATSKEKNKHLIIQREITLFDPKIRQLYVKMYNLRLWADYDFTDKAPPPGITKDFPSLIYTIQQVIDSKDFRKIS